MKMKRAAVEYRAELYSEYYRGYNNGATGLVYHEQLDSWEPPPLSTIMYAAGWKRGRNALLHKAREVAKDMGLTDAQAVDAITRPAPKDPGREAS